MEYKYDLSSGACVSQCDKYGDEFIVYATTAVQGHNDKQIKVKMCALCL